MSISFWNMNIATCGIFGHAKDSCFVKARQKTFWIPKQKQQKSCIENPSELSMVQSHSIFSELSTVQTQEILDYAMKHLVGSNFCQSDIKLDVAKPSCTGEKDHIGVTSTNQCLGNMDTIGLENNKKKRY